MITKLSDDLSAMSLDGVHLTLTSEAGDVNILRGVDLSVTTGEAVGIVGPSGGGKSTMMMVIAGLERASSGTVKTAGIDLARLTEDELALFRRDNIGIVFQDFHLFPTMTALENVAMPLELAESPDVRNNAFDRAKEQLFSVGLGDRILHYPSQLSGGEQQRVAVARAFVSSPKILLADEPTGNLDSRQGAEIVDLLYQIAKNAGQTVILVTHSEAAARLGDTVYALQDGQLEPRMLSKLATKETA